MKHVKTTENFFDKAYQKGFDAINKLDPKDNEHYQRAVDHIVAEIESGNIDPTDEEGVKNILKTHGGMRIPFTNKRATGKFAEKGFSRVVDTFASRVLADALKVAEIPEPREDWEKEYESTKSNMKYVKTFEGMDSWLEDGNEEDAYLETPEYFIETWFNGQFGQLKTMLQMFRSQNRMSDVISEIEQTMSGEEKEDLKNWLIEN